MTTKNQARAAAQAAQSVSLFVSYIWHGEWREICLPLASLRSAPTPRSLNDVARFFVGSVFVVSASLRYSNGAFVSLE